MKKLTVKLEHCYGIKKLEYTFKFDDTNRTYAIYAPNGSMKTSFANTFRDYSLSLDSSDLIFKDRITKRDITEESGPLEVDQVFVLEPHNTDYTSKKTSTLLVNKDLKKQYDDIWNEIEKFKEVLVSGLKKQSGIRSGVEDELSTTIVKGTGSNEFINAIKRVKAEVLSDKDPVLDKIEYKTIFNTKVAAFLDDDKLKTELNDYITRYEELIDGSKYFRKGIFNHSNASAIAKTLVANGFFDASHTVSFSDELNHNKNEVASKAELEEMIQKEMEEILSDEKLLKAFEKIDKKLSNAELKAFRDYLVLNKELIPELSNLPRLKDKVWIDYLKACKDAYQALVEAYEAAEKRLQSIQDQAKKEITKWKEVVDTFNERFSVPFSLSVENQEDVILQGVLPVLAFEFKDKEESKKVQREELVRVLSNGEKKALYVLNLLFEIEARKSDKLDTLLIVDDVADSFDYKNKYAIIEYLKDNVEHEKFYQIILTHNFDFYRTICSRFPIPRPSCLMVDKHDNKVELVEASYIYNPFDWFLKNSSDDSMFLALIPFMRNLIEFTKGMTDPDYIALTAVLHQKPDSQKITKKHINDIMDRLFPNNKVKVADPGKVIIDLFEEKAQTLVGTSENLKLENKIILSIAIRLKAEKYLVKVKDKKFIGEITTNQTAKLITQYIKENPSSLKEQRIFKRVSVVTPQNIHLNSFMYEPILDMSDVELKDLYADVSSL